jgi:hypothetical protein
MIVISKEIKRFGGRDIIYVNLKAYRQPFYRSTGCNSGMPGVWLPFDGIGFKYGLWFDKTIYCRPYSEIHRYGNQELWDISKKLSLLQIPEGERTDPEQINIWLGTETSLQWNEALKENWDKIRRGENFKKWIEL